MKRQTKNSDVPRCTDFACAADVYVHALAKGSVRKKQATAWFTVASGVGKNMQAASLAKGSAAGAAETGRRRGAQLLRVLATALAEAVLLEAEGVDGAEDA